MVTTITSQITDKEIRKLVRRAEAVGWRIEKTRSGHFKVKPPGRPFFFMGSTASDRRALNNVKAQFRKSGLESDEVKATTRRLRFRQENAC